MSTIVEKRRIYVLPHKLRAPSKHLGSGPALLALKVQGPIFQRFTESITWLIDETLYF